jgi:hypothetical protein
MSVIQWNPTGELTHYQTEDVIDRLPFVQLSKEGWRYFSGSDVHVYFGDVHVAEMDSIGLQLAQNIAPIYGYHSHIWQGLQYGAKLVQGYFRLHLVDNAYLTTVLDTLERERAVGVQGELYRPTAPGKINTGKSLAAAVRQFSEHTEWTTLADAYDAAQWGYRESDAPKVRTPYGAPRPLANDFHYNAYGTSLRRRGFTISLVLGDLDRELAAAATTTNKGKATTLDLNGTNHRLYGTSIKLY